MERLTENDNFEEHLGDGMHCDYVKFPDGKCVIYNKLAEYENLGSVEDFKHLKHELEVYKRAFINSVDYADETINKIYRADCCCSYEMESENYFLNQARKELEDESKSN